MKEITFNQESYYEDFIQNDLKEEIQIFLTCTLERKPSWFVEKKKKVGIFDLLGVSNLKSPRSPGRSPRNIPKTKEILPLQTILKDRRKEKYKNIDELELEDDKPTVFESLKISKEKIESMKHQRTISETKNDVVPKEEYINQNLNIHEKLFDLISRSHLSEFKKVFFNEKVNPNLYHPKERKTLLQKAICLENSKIIEFLVESGANVNECDKQQRSPLLLACSTGNKDICIYLLGNGAKISHRDAYGYSALFLALKKHHFHLVNDLILFGADINLKRDNGMTPLHEALYNNDEEMLDEILKIKGLKLNIKDTSQKTPLLKACETSSTRLFIKFIKVDGVDINSFDESGRNIFHFLCINKRCDILKEFSTWDIKELGKFKNLIIQPDNMKKNTPLYFAVENASFHCLKYLFSICDKLKLDPINEANLYEVAYKNLEREYTLACSLYEGVDYNDIFEEHIRKDYKYIEQILYPLQIKQVKQQNFSVFASKSTEEVDFEMK